MGIALAFTGVFHKRFALGWNTRVRAVDTCQIS